MTTFAGAALLWAAGWAGMVSYWWLPLPGGVFIVLLVVHERVIPDRETAASAITFYERGLARIEDRWHGTGESGERFRDDRHLYANDLDLFGRPAWLRHAAMLATAFMVFAVVFAAMTREAGPAAVALVVQLLFAGALARRTLKCLQSAENHGRDLDVLRRVLKRLEAEQFTTARLAALRRQLDTHGTPASASVRSLRRLIDMNE